MNFFGYFFFFMLAIAVGAILWAWWHKFLGKGEAIYGKGPGHELRGPERQQWDRIKEREHR